MWYDGALSDAAEAAALIEQFLLYFADGRFSTGFFIDFKDGYTLSLKKLFLFV